MVFERHQGGYTAAVVSAHDGKQWRKMAISRPIGHVAYSTTNGKTVESDIIPANCEVLKPDGSCAKVCFTAQRVDEDGATWNFAYIVEIEGGKPMVKTCYQARADRDRQLRYFQGLDLYTGEGSFGSRKRLALFPGVEYLEGEEKSSSGRDNGPRSANR